MNNSFYIILSLLSLLGCNSNNTNENSSIITKDVKKIKYEILDSIPLFNSESSFSFANLEKIEQDSILVFQHPVLNLTLINSKGNILKQISQKGNEKGFFNGDFIKPLWGKDGKLYVLDAGINTHLYIFNQNLDFEKKIPLTGLNYELYVIPFRSDFIITKKDKDALMSIILSAAIKDFHYHSKPYYENAHSIFSTTYNHYTNQLEDKQYFLSYNEFEVIKEKIKRNERTWDLPIAKMVQSETDSIIIKYEFDDYIYIYDANFQLARKLELHPIFSQKIYTSNFSPISDINESLTDAWKFRYANTYYNTLAATKDKIFIIYPKPISLNKVPKTIESWQNHISIPILHILDKITSEEYSMEMPTNLSLEYLYPIKDNIFYMLGNSTVREDIYAYKIQLIYE